SISKRILFAFTYLVGSALILTLFIRGGWQQIPISSTDAYFSQKQIVNDVSVNPEWSFIRTCYAYFKVDLSSYYRNIDPIEAEKIRASLYQNEGVDTVRIFNQEKPNIVLVTLEGWSGQIIEPLGGEEGITPNFDALCDELGVDEVRLKTVQVYDFETGNDLIPTKDKFSRYRKLPDGTFELKNKFKNKCWRMWSSCVFTWDGTIVPCCFDKDATHDLGSLKSNQFDAVWKSSIYHEFRTKVFKDRQAIEICKNCSEGSKVWV
ncbi:SPASM domain-containing protein, partial [Crocinitomix sp.]|nr:SPASM domain-containing protein [Crocinitomix sp.]